MTRGGLRKLDEFNPKNQEFTDVNPEVAALEKKHQEVTKVRNIEKILFGQFEINTWYYSPYPEEYGQQKMLYICGFCLKYMRKRKTYVEHVASKCGKRTPPGYPVYFDRDVASLNPVIDEEEAKEEQKGGESL
jgi:histone acetyltransferase MYST1